MFECILFTFNKEKNSTRRPNRTSNALNATTYQGVFVYDFSMVNPVVRITNAQNFPNTEQAKTPYIFNYMYIPSIARYYFIDNWTMLESGMYEAHCTEDCLASFFYEISQSSAYIQRCSKTSEKNDAIADMYYPTSMDYITLSSDLIPAWTKTNTNRITGIASSFNDCTYVIGVVSNENVTVGALTYYFAPRTELAKMVLALVSNFDATQPTNWSATALSSSMLKSLVSPMQYLKSCIAVPVTSDFEGAQNYSITAATWDTTAKGFVVNPGSLIDNPIRQLSFDIDVPKPVSNPETGFDANDWFRYPPYADYQLVNTMFGVIPLDGMICSQQTKLHCVIEINFISGDITLEVYSKDPLTNLYTYLMTRQVVHPSVDIPIADVSYNYVGMIKSAGKAVSDASNVGAWLTNPVGNAVSLLDNALDAFTATLSPSVTSSGGQAGCFSNRSGQFHLQARFFKPYNQYVPRFGVAVKKRGYLYNYYASNSSGEPTSKTFVSATDVELITHYPGFTRSMYTEERDIILAKLAEGVFFEGVVSSDAYE